jgi:transcription initiation factor IIF auxiliary subunit
VSIKIRNKWQYKNDDRWNWQAFLDDAGSGELNKVEEVEYILHPTFPNPVRNITTKDNQFELEANGWGTFELKAFVKMKNGKKIKLKHNLELRYDKKEGVSD